MNQRCKSESCKAKLSEYRDLTRKQDDEIDSLETDIKDKDAFVQKIRKARNALESELSLLQIKNHDLIKENDDLLEKVDQLDQDTDDGIKMLRNAHERQRKLNKEVDELKESSKLKCALMDTTVKENEEFKKKFHFVKNKLEAGLKETHDIKRLSYFKDERIQLVMQLQILKVIHRMRI